MHTSVPKLENKKIRNVLENTKIGQCISFCSVLVSQMRNSVFFCGDSEL